MVCVTSAHIPLTKAGPMTSPLSGAGEEDKSWQGLNVEPPWRGGSTGLWTVARPITASWWPYLKLPPTLTFVLFLCGITLCCHYFYFVFNLFCWSIIDLRGVLISSLLQSGSVMQMFLLFHIRFHYGLSQDVEYSFLCCRVRPCCLYILPYNSFHLLIPNFYAC